MSDRAVLMYGIAVTIIISLLFAIWVSTAAHAQYRYRCTVSVMGMLAHTSTYSSHDTCTAACAAVVASYYMQGKREVVGYCSAM